MSKKLVFKPAPGKVLLKPILIEPKQKGKGEIITSIHNTGAVSDKAEMEEVWEGHPFQAEVIAIGKELPIMPVDFEVGDIVYLNRECRIQEVILVNKTLYANLRHSEIEGSVGPPVKEDK